jgi:hypothetical protein
MGALARGQADSRLNALLILTILERNGIGKATASTEFIPLWPFCPARRPTRQVCARKQAIRILEIIGYDIGPFASPFGGL